MKICICCSLSFTNEVLALSKELELLGHEPLLPNGMINHVTEQEDFDPVKTKAATDAVRKHIDKIREADAILVCNYDKNGIENYIGANTFIEIAAAHYMHKPIYFLNSLPKQAYIQDEIESFDATILNGDLSKIQRAPSTKA